jgi:hypothetical protein
LQRMETPVTYFYTDQPRTVEVRVDFPQGLLTEWYPVVKNPEPAFSKTDPPKTGFKYLDWGTVRLTPQEQFADIRVRSPVVKKLPFGDPLLDKHVSLAANDAQWEALPASLPPVSADDHYGRARETDAAIVETVDAEGGSNFEKFLFYRGVGNFDLPLKLVALGNDRFEVSNTGDMATGALILLRAEKGRIRFTRLDPVAACATSEIRLPATFATIGDLADATEQALVEAGLYEKEARAMVNTWRSSWFGEDGTRLLYLLPEKLTDELLPLSIKPAPDERVRVMVGRLETLTPEDCQRLARVLAEPNAATPPTNQAVKFALAPLGRFAEPAVQFIISQTADQGARERLETVLAGLRK